MKTICIAYLLLKSLLNRPYTWFDCRLAEALKEHAEESDPEWLSIIANADAGHGVLLPEVWADFRFELCNRGG